MPMISLNISLPEALKEYMEGQVGTGDWGPLAGGAMISC